MILFLSVDQGGSLAAGQTNAFEPYPGLLKRQDVVFFFPFDRKPDTNAEGSPTWSSQFDPNITLDGTSLLWRHQRVEASLAHRATAKVRSVNPIIAENGFTLSCTVGNLGGRDTKTLISISLINIESGLVSSYEFQSRSLLASNAFLIDGKPWPISIELISIHANGKSETLANQSIEFYDTPSNSSYCAFAVDAAGGVLFVGSNRVEFPFTYPTASCLSVTLGGGRFGFAGRLDNLICIGRKIFASESDELARPFPIAIESPRVVRSPFGMIVFVDVLSGEQWRKCQMLRTISLSTKWASLPTQQFVYDNPMYTPDGWRFSDYLGASAFYLMVVQ